MPLVPRAVARSHVGLVRQGNEDSGYAGRSLFVVADGMGGQVAGEVASRTVVAALVGLDGAELGPDPLDTLRTAVREANDRLRVAVEARPDLDGMGTTLTALAWNGTSLGLAHVGDSRAYLLRDGVLSQLTHDQTLVQTLIDDGRISEEQARTHPQRAVILQAMDGREELDVDLQQIDPSPGDRFLICSDGLSGYVSAASLADTLSIPDPSLAVDQLISRALDAGAPDNVTVIVIDTVDAEEGELPADSPDDATHAPGGVLVGAVGETAAASTVVSNTPSAAGATDERAGKRRHADPAPVSDDEDALDDESTGGRRRLWPWLVALLLVVVLGAGVAAWRWSQDQWYVGVDNGNVAIFSGLDVSLGPMTLNTVQQETSIEVVTLPEFAREEVVKGITASDEASAEAIVQRLQAAANSCLSAPETLGCP